MKLSLICPTIGRSTLRNTIEAVYPDLDDSNEMIVVGDGPMPAHIYALLKFFPKVGYNELPKRTHDFGCSPCDFGVDAATGDFVFFIGDDDTSCLGTFTTVRSGIGGDRSRAHVFAMSWQGKTLANSTKLGEISGQQIVTPRRADIPRMAATAHKRMIEESDYSWIEAVITLYGEPIFHPEPIAICDKMGRARIF